MIGSRFQTALIALAVLLLLAACGGQAGTQTASPSPAPESPAAESPAAESPTAEESPAAESPAAGGELVVYSGRNEELVGPLIERFREETGINVRVNYGDTAELAVTILEEGRNSPADVFFAQDAGALGALQEEDRLQELPDSLLERVDERFRSDDGEWVGVSGRARTVVYNTGALSESDLPESIMSFTDPQWKGRLGWAPTNASFQSFVTALRQLEGEERAREWLEGVLANEPKVYDRNTAIVNAVGAGEIDAGFVNHYYLQRTLAEQGESFPARNYFFRNGDPGALVNVAGAGILDTARNQTAAEQFIAFLLSDESQQFFAEQTYEYPLVDGVDADPGLPSLDELQTPDIDLSDLEDLEGTLQLLQELGIL
jgi:iron(III) transport system substrate-binding protein